LCPVYSQLNKGVISKPLKSSGIGDSLFPFLETESASKVLKIEINCKIAHGCRRKVQIIGINCKTVHGYRRKVQNSDINCKIAHGWGFGVNSATKKGLVPSLLLMSSFETAPFVLLYI
jgi:hypothetical protein